MSADSAEARELSDLGALGRYPGIAIDRPGSGGRNSFGRAELGVPPRSETRVLRSGTPTNCG